MTARAAGAIAPGGSRGSVLVIIIISMAVVASLGTAMMVFYSSTTVSQTGADDFTRAYYLAEAGGRYGIKQIVDLEYGGSTPPSDTDRTTLVNSLNNKTFTLDDGTQFTLALAYADFLYTLQSTGALAAGAQSSSVTREITYEINVYRPPGDAAGVTVLFDSDPNDSKSLNQDNWNTVGDVEVESDTRLEAEGGTDVMVSLDWNNASSTQPDLEEVWSHSDNLLTYEIQIKIDMKTDDLVAGISFRLDTGGDSTITNDEFYGFSLLDKDNGSNLPSFVDRDGNPASFSSNSQYIILWKQVAGVKTVLEKISAPLTILSGYDFASNVGIIIRVQEQYDASGNRENLITAYYVDSTTYPVGTINWDYSDFNKISWTGCDASVDCSAADDCSCIVDSTLTSANFSTNTPDEIGLHVLGGDASDKADLRDFAIRFNFNGGQSTQY